MKEKHIENCRLENGGHFVSASMCLQRSINNIHNMPQ